MHIGTAVKWIGLVGAFLRQPPFFLRPGFHRTPTRGAIDVPPQQVVFFIEWQMTFVHFIGLELFLRSLKDDGVNDSRYATGYFPPVRMHHNLTSAVRPDGLLLFADNQDADVFQVL